MKTNGNENLAWGLQLARHSRDNNFSSIFRNVEMSSIFRKPRNAPKIIYYPELNCSFFIIFQNVETPTLLETSAFLSLSLSLWCVCVCVCTDTYTYVYMHTHSFIITVLYLNRDKATDIITLKYASMYFPQIRVPSYITTTMQIKKSILMQYQSNS